MGGKIPEDQINSTSEVIRGLYVVKEKLSGRSVGPLPTILTHEQISLRNPIIGCFNYISHKSRNIELIVKSTYAIIYYFLEG